jgi:hypothetical protein
VHHLECPLATLSCKKSAYIYIYIYIETRENLTEATYMEDTIYVEKERTKEEKRGNIHIYENRKEKKHKIIPIS